MTKVIDSIFEMQQLGVAWGSKQVGFVPTMGHLHRGHMTLVEHSKRECDVTVVSIFVNPIQFDKPEDLEKYPRTLEDDLRQLDALGVDYVFAPKATENFFPDNARYRINESSHHLQACGRTRPGHLTGSMTICMKLFNIVRPHKAYFGQKDYQQWQLMVGMCEAFFMPVEICGMPTIREESGLAMNSRNTRLSESSRQKAGEFYHILKSGGSIAEVTNKLESAGFKPDYVEDLSGRRLAAIWLDGIRLMDNVVLEG